MATSNNNVQIEVQFLTGKALRSVQKLHDSITNTVNKSNRLGNVADKVSNGFKKAREASNKMQNDLKKADLYSKSMAESATIFAKAFVGVAMGTQFLEAAETYGSAVNKLNNINAQQLGAAGVESYYDKAQGRESGRYSSATKDLTSKQLDQIYAASNRSRSNYGAMIGNVGKQALLAGDAFNNNMDNVIKFNELMAKAYAISGATAEEQSASMMQLTQALGSGVMQGDELKSVREGATLAYQAIEDFAQEVYDTDESLKELGSQGKVTSDLIVAAMLKNADKLDAAMAMTEMTVGQFWTVFKNDAFKAFEPALQAFHEFVGKLAASPIYEQVRKAMFGVGNAVAMVFKLFSGLLDLITKYKDVVMPFLSVLIWTITAVLAKAVVGLHKQIISMILKLLPIGESFFKIAAKVMILYGAFVLIYNVYEKLTNGVLQGNTMIAMSLLTLLGIMILFKSVLALIGGNFVQAFLGFGVTALLGFLAYSIYTRDSVIEGIAHIVGVIAASVARIIAFFQYCWQACGQAMGAFKAYVLTEAENIKQVFKNLCNNIEAFWGDMISRLSKTKVGKWLGLESLTNAQYVELDSNVKDAMGAFEGYLADHPINVDIGAAGDAAYSKWYDKTAGFLNGANDKIKNTLSGGLNPGYLNPASPDFTGALGDIGDTADNTDKISNQLGMVTEDLSYLKELAELEWKKEFTTANINVTMTNNNTIDNKADIGDIAVQFRDALVSQLNTVAAGSANYS